MQNNQPNRRENGNHPVDNHVRARTLGAVAFLIIFGFGLLLYQLYALQLRDREGYRAEASAQQLSDQQIPATRGSIYSANGKLLAKSNVVWNVVADPSLSDQAFTEEASQEIARLLGDETLAADILQKLNAEGSRYKVLARSVDLTTANAILDYANQKRKLDEDDEDEVAQKRISLYLEQTSTRDYPYGSFLAPVLGFCDSEGNGIYGLEKSYNTELAGIPGRVISSQNALGYELDNTEANTHDAINGYDLYLTIDENIQAIVEEYLERGNEDYNVQNRSVGIVMDVNTGAILAMATVGQFDPNKPYEIADEALQNILDSEALTAADIELLKSRLGETAVEPYVEDGKIDETEYSQVQGMIREAQWKNKNITELYFPGSVFKLVTAAAALDSGAMTTEQSFYCSGAYLVNENTANPHTYHCALNEVHNWLNMTEALNKSCNLYFIQAGEKLGSDLFYDYFEAFGFTQTTGIDLPSETPWMYYYDKQELASEVTYRDSSYFGQAQTITPLQMATAVAATVNGGYLLTPYVVDHITDESGNVVQQNGTTIRRQVISEEVSDQIRQMMEYVVGEGEDGRGGRTAYVAGYRIGGKSGTGEQLNLSVRPTDGDYRKAMSFAAVLPIDDPEILVFVMMDDPRAPKDYASQVVAPVVGNIISEVAPYLGLARDADYVPEGQVQVPNCVGKNWTTAQIDLNVKGFSHKLVGESGEIVYQYPYGGTSAPAGSTIYLYTQSDQDTMATVPDLVGKTGSFAVQMLRAANLNVQLEGDETARVTSQSVAYGSSVAYGTVITITTGGDAATEPDPAQTQGTQDPAGADPEAGT